MTIDHNALLNEFEDTKAAYHKLVATKGKELLSAIFTQLFAVSPKVKRIRWTQYTPYFNDGEACTFGVYERGFDIGELPEGEDAEDYEDEEWAELWYEARWNGWEPAQIAKLTELDRVLDRLEDVLEATFGDHATIIASRGENGDIVFDVESCNHD